MTPNAVARRYSAALFDVVRRTNAIDRTEQELNGLRDLVARHDDLRRVFETPIVPAPKKRAVVDAVLAASGDVSGEVRRLLEMLADRDRLIALPAIAAAFTERAMQSRHVVAAEVTTAVPLAAEKRASLADALGRATGGAVTMTEKVDPSIIGGVIAKVGSVVFDGSVTRQLARMRDQLRSE
jgi:F-type H+-transporting ATPase subunit delta